MDSLIWLPMEKMNIVVIDGYSINPGDLTWDSLKRFGNLSIYDRCSYEEAAERLKNADIAVVNKVRFDRELIDKLDRLKFISLTATGYNNLDVNYLREKGIAAANVSGYGSFAVAQHSIALLLELANKISQHAEEVKAGEWAKVNDFCFWTAPMTELYGLKMGIVGWGGIGSQVGKIAAALGMEVQFYSRTQKQNAGAIQVESIETLFRTSDVISLHCLLNDETQELINEESIAWMKPNAFIINTSRGGLINEKALFDALNKGKISGAGLDVLSLEPPKNGNILIGAHNCIITPHNAWSPRATRQRLMTMAEENISAFLDGKMQNLVT